jgi:hypothetical protein
MNWLLRAAMAVSVTLACIVTVACLILLAPFGIINWWYRRAR